MIYTYKLLKAFPPKHLERIHQPSGLFFHNSIIIHRIIHKIVFGYFDLYFLLFITIKYDMKTAQKIVNNSMKENRLPLKVSSLRYNIGDIWG